VQKVPKKLMYDKGDIPLDGKPIRDWVGFDQFQKSPSANGVDDTSFQKEMTARTVEDSTFLE
jgi:hypothetical protein